MDSYLLRDKYDLWMLFVLGPAGSGVIRYYSTRMGDAASQPQSTEIRGEFRMPGGKEYRSSVVYSARELREIWNTLVTRESDSDGRGWHRVWTGSISTDLLSLYGWHLKRAVELLGAPAGSGGGK